MKIGLLVGLPLAMWLFIDLLVPNAIGATAEPTRVDFRDFLGPILGAILGIIGPLLGLTPDTSKDLLVWSPFIFGAMLGFLLPLFILLGIRISTTGLADETVHALHIFLFFLALYLIAGLPAILYLTAIAFPFALLLFATTSIAYMIGVFGLIARGS